MGWFSKKDGDKAPARPAPKPAAKSAKSNAAKAGAAAAPAMTQDDVKASLERSRRTLASLGELMSVMMRSPRHQAMTLAQVKALIGPAMDANQYLVATAHNKERGAAVPVAAVLWANVSADIDRKLSENLAQPLALKPEDWKSGNIPWLIAAIGDQNMTQHLVAAVHKKLGRALKTRVNDKDGKASVQVLGAPARRPEEAVN